MTQGESQTSSDAAQSISVNGRLRSAAAVALGFGDGIARRLRAPHALLSLRDEGIGRRPGLATSARRTEIDRAPVPALPALHDRDLPPALPSQPPERVRKALPHEPQARPRLPALAAAPEPVPGAPRPRGAAGESTAPDHLADMSSSRSRIATLDAAPPRRAGPSEPTQSASHRPPEIGASPPPLVAPRRERPMAMEVRWQPAVERAAAAGRDAGEHSPTTVVVIGPPPGAAGRGRGAAPVAMSAPNPREPADTPPSARAIEALIERTTRPTPMPGLEFRLVKSAPREADAPAGRDAEEPGASAPRRPAAAPPAAPPLDIRAIADKVYRLLQQRQRLERERKGHL